MGQKIEAVGIVPSGVASSGGVPWLLRGPRFTISQKRSTQILSLFGLVLAVGARSNWLRGFPNVGGPRCATTVFTASNRGRRKLATNLQRAILARVREGSLRRVEAKILISVQSVRSTRTPRKHLIQPDMGHLPTTPRSVQTKAQALRPSAPARERSRQWDSIFVTWRSGLGARSPRWTAIAWRLWPSVSAACSSPCRQASRVKIAGEPRLWRSLRTILHICIRRVRLCGAV